MFVRSVSVLALAAAVSQPAAAQDAAGEIQLAALDTESIVVIGRHASDDEGLTRTATKTDTPVIDVPQAISIFPEERIKDQAMLSLADVLAYVPGVTMGQGEGNRDQPTLRGNATSADFFIDGVRDDVQFYRDLYNISRVEILKGPNAMIFGRGGGGGVINRVRKHAENESFAGFSGLVDHRGSVRFTGDVNAPLGASVAGRLNAVYEDADSFRESVELERYGINPTLGADLGNTRLDLSYEYFHDRRIADRGLPSLDGRPLKGHRRTFFGDPDESYSRADVHVVSLAAEHDFGSGLVLRNRTQYADYDKFYQNIYPNSAVDTSGNLRLGAYNDSTDRRNLFSQTDLLWTGKAAGLEHRFLLGFEVGRQDTLSVRNTGTFLSPVQGRVPASNPTVDAEVAFATRANDNDGRADVLAFYAQDQIKISDAFEIVAGLRFDRFDLDVENRITGGEFGQTEDLVSPRLGLVVKPLPALSFYASYSRSYLPSSGDQFVSLAANVEDLKAERFDNYEVGAKWEVRPGLLATAAVYQLDRVNTRAVDPANPLLFVTTGAQRSRGVELEVSGQVARNWQIAVGYALQEAEITKTTSSAPAGRDVPLVPKHQFSLWNRYDLTPQLGIGLGLVAATKSYASISNAVTLPGYARVDAALFYRVSDHLEAQVNVENLFDETYFPTAHNDNNIGPGAPTTVRATIRFRI